MRLRRLNLPHTLQVPRALAVLSCALVLLAVSPAIPVHAITSPAITVSAPAQQRISSIESLTRRTSTTASTRAIRDDSSLFSSARRLHILATVEILKRLLWSRPDIQPEHCLAPVLVLDPLCVQLTALPLPLPVIAAEGSLPPPERQFAIEHCLLAPPLA